MLALLPTRPTASWRSLHRNTAYRSSACLKAVSAPERLSSATQSVEDMSSVFDLSHIRSSLIRQEDTIIFNLIERAQFKLNKDVYQRGAIPVPGYFADGQRYSLLEYVLMETEQLHGKLRRYTSPDEHPFFPEDVPALVLPPITYPAVLHHTAMSININDQIMDMYLNRLLPVITSPGDDFNHGSTAILDASCLQALSRRIHYGKFVAEAKFRSQTELYTEFIKAGDTAGIMDLLTDRAVELKVVERVRRKAATYGQDIDVDGNGNSAGTPHYKVGPEEVARLYDDVVMPLTKEVQVRYLLKRLDV